MEDAGIILSADPEPGTICIVSPSLLVEPGPHGESTTKEKRAMKRTLATLAAVLLLGGVAAGCTAYAESEPYDASPPAQVIEPTSEPIDSGTPEQIHRGALMIDLRVGDTHTVVLDSNPSTGYQWQIGWELDESLLELVEHRFDVDSELNPPPPGTGGKEFFTFHALAHGMVEFSFNYKRPWEDEVLKTGRYIFNIGVAEALAEEMSEGEARTIAEKSECGKAGALKENANYNEWTGTWWIDLDAQMEYCTPACVVNVAARQAEVNWRCMGALPVKEKSIEYEVPGEWQHGEFYVAEDGSRHRVSIEDPVEVEGLPCDEIAIDDQAIPVSHVSKEVVVLKVGQEASPIPEAQLPAVYVGGLEVQLDTCREEE